MECAGRALSFWAYQTTQNIYYQQYLYKTLTEKYSALNSRLEQTVNDANAQIETLQRKINSLATENDSTRKKNEELSKAYKEKNRQLLQTQELHDKLRHTVEMSHIQRAATDAIDSRFQQPARHCVPQSIPQNNANLQQTNVSGLRAYGAAVDHERIPEGGIRGGLMDTDGGGTTGPWRRDGSATGSTEVPADLGVCKMLIFVTGYTSNGASNFQRFGTRGVLDTQRGLGLGNAPNSAEKRQAASFKPAAGHVGGFSTGIKVSQPMANNGLQSTSRGLMGMGNM